MVPNKSLDEPWGVLETKNLPYTTHFLTLKASIPLLEHSGECGEVQKLCIACTEFTKLITYTINKACLFDHINEVETSLKTPP
jgi:hypothetical protein